MRRSCVIATTIVIAIVVLFPLHALPRTWYVEVDGSGDAPTLQAAVDSVSQDDTILVASGTYTWTNQGGGTNPGMIFVQRGTPDFYFIGEGGRSVTTLDAQGQGRILALEAETIMTIEGFTFRNGTGTTWPGTGLAGGAIWSHLTFPVIRNCTFRLNEGSHGGAVFYGGVGAITIEDCLFAFNTATNAGAAVFVGGSPDPNLTSFISRCTMRDNTVTGELLSGGGAVYATDMQIVIEECLMYRNTVAGQGGAIQLTNDAFTTIRRCTIAENEATIGGAIVATGNTVTTIESSILSRNTGVDPVHVVTATGAVTISCCNVFGNVPDDWTGAIAGENGRNGNFTANPLFCPPGGLLYGLAADSPCAPGNHPDGVDCGVIGRRLVLCGAVPTEKRSWGGIKALFDRRE